MALIRFEPARELDTLQREMNRLFGAAFDGESTGARGWLPAMDLVEEDDALVLRADLPGVEEGSIGVEFQENVLTIRASASLRLQYRMAATRGSTRPPGPSSRPLPRPGGAHPPARR